MRRIFSNMLRKNKYWLYWALSNFIMLNLHCKPNLDIFIKRYVTTEPTKDVNSFFFFFFFFLMFFKSFTAKKPLKCVVRLRKHLIDRFLWTHSLILRAILTSKLQKNICKNIKMAKTSRYQNLPELLKSFKLTVSILSAFNNCL